MNKKGDRKPKRFKYNFTRKDYPANVRYKFDADYLDQLSPEELAWYQEFTEGFIGASFDKDSELFNQAQRREEYRRKNYANRDLYSVQDSVGLIDRPEDIHTRADPNDGRDWSHAPAYLQSETYRELRTELRQAIDDADNTKPKTPEREAATRRVAALHAKLERLSKLAP